MKIKHISDIKSFDGNEGSIIKNLISPKDNDKIKYSLAHVTLKKGSRTTKHVLNSSEVYYILSGKGRISIDEKLSEISENDFLQIPNGTPQYIENTGTEDLEFLCIVEPAWKPEDEEILE